MKLKILKGTNDNKDQILEVTSSQSKIIIGFGEDIATGYIPESVNPIIEGLTTGKPSYDGVFILRNPENCNLIKHVLKEVPIYLEKKVNIGYQIIADFKNLTKFQNIKEIKNSISIKIKDLEITYFLIDPTNANTSMLLLKSGNEKVLVSGDFRNFDVSWGKSKLDDTLSEIGKIDYWFIEGKYFGKNVSENASMEEAIIKLKNIIKFYKQVFVLQSETDLMTAKLMYNVAMKTRKIYIENTFLANLTANINGSAPNPVTSKKVYTYTPLNLDNKDFEFRKKYVAPFSIHNANLKMKKEKFVLNINNQMFQDMQLFHKEEIIYDGCLIFAMNKNLAKNSNMEEFINNLKDLDLDYYELYTVGQVNYNLLNELSIRLSPKKVFPVNINKTHGNIGNIHNFAIPNNNEIN